MTITYSIEPLGAVGDFEALAARVDETLDDPRGWTGDGRLDFERVTSGARVRIRLTTPLAILDHAPGVCSVEWSCTIGSDVYLNVVNFRGATAAWRGAGGALAEFQRMEVNHQVGHALGLSHKACPGPGARAPVMQLQAIALNGCVPNPWPLEDEQQAMVGELGLAVR